MDAKIDGAVAFVQDDAAFLLYVATGKKINLPLDTVGYHWDSLHVSPDRHWIVGRASQAKARTSLIVMTSQGQIKVSLPWETRWTMISGWLDNTHLFISQQRGDGYPEEADSLLILNPFTGQVLQEFLPNFPEHPEPMYWYPAPNWPWFWRSNTIYDPSLSKVIYPGTGDNGRLIVRDLQTNQVIAVLNGTLSIGVAPKWSPEGQRLIVLAPPNTESESTEMSYDSAHDELFSIEQDGKVVRLTYLTDNHTEVAIEDFAWSPDGSKVAFWAGLEPSTYPAYPDAEPGAYYRLAVLDLTSSEVTNYCIPEYQGPPPIWSPDGSKIIVQHMYGHNPPGDKHIYLVDIVEHFAISIAENATPFGWVNSTP